MNFLYKIIILSLLLTTISSCQEDETDETINSQSIITLETPKSAPAKKDWSALLENPYEAIDQHARKSPRSVEKDISSLANYLKEKATTDLEKSRAIYVWIAEHVKYDDKAFNAGKYGDYSPDGVLKNRKAVCEGFSNLYQALGQEMDIKVEKISGYSKGYGYVVGTKFDKSNHAWNAMQIDGEWRIFDATWGQGSGTTVRGKLVSKKEFNDYWFNTDPYEAIFSHMPEDPKYTFVEPTLTLNDYEKMPHVSAEYFKLGFGSKALYTQVYDNMKTEFPTCYTVNTLVKVATAPPLKALELNESYDFEFYAPEGVSMAAIDAKNNWTHFEKEAGLFKLKYSPKQQGDLKISIQLDEKKKTYHGILMYEVKKGKGAI